MSVPAPYPPAIGVIGAGAWGTALAQMVASDGSAVVLWAYEAEVVEEIGRASVGKEC